jgi:hypothetical protein
VINHECCLAALVGVKLESGLMYFLAINLLQYSHVPIRTILAKVIYLPEKKE